MKLDDPVTLVRGVGDSVATKLEKLGITTIGDLIDYYPRKYDDYSHIHDIGSLRPGTVTIKATIKQAVGRYAKRGLHITEAVASDKTGSVRLIWFNQPYRASSIDTKKHYYIRGEFALRRQKLSIMNPAVELTSDFPVHSARIVPTYGQTKGLKSAQLRKMIKELLPEIQKLPETLPRWLIDRQEMISRSEALQKLHFPESQQDITDVQKRLGFEEVFQLTLAALLNKAANAGEVGVSVSFKEDKARKFVKSLPFPLTDSQRKVTWQIYKDLEKVQPMNRLLEGDVGSGKTVVACMAALMVMNAGKQVAFMAPTEILARQHADTLSSLLEPLGMEGSVTLILGSMTTKQKKLAYEAIKAGKAQLIIGTSALIQEKVNMNDLALVIIDEQHRFGVEQRKKLQSKARLMPHVLSMTATPIPRSLALTLYGELDVSIISEKPMNRLPILTKIVSPNSTDKMYEKTNEQLGLGRQVFVVCPAIVESEMETIKSVTATYDSLRSGKFAKRKVGLLHGKLKSLEKETVMKDFCDGKIDVLVSTTVIEVGVDVPNASVMIIESPERFGLAQVHQLRGRVGRSGYQGYCFLVMSDSAAPGRRLKALESVNDGFELAELDLEIRGPGAIYGTMQHGVIDLRIAKLSDTRLIASARDAAQEFIDSGEKLIEYKELNENVQKLRSVTNLN